VAKINDSPSRVAIPGSPADVSSIEVERTTALAGLRICDFSGQLAGAGATRFLAALGAEVIRIEDPVTQGYWDALRGMPPFVDDRRGRDLGGAFNNHNVGKLGVTLNLRTEAGKDLLRELVAICDVVTENFAAGVLSRLGFSYTDLRSMREDIIYVSNSGFGHVGPYRDFKTWGPIVQAACGLTLATGEHGEPAGIGYSYMDHQGANFMAIAVLTGLLHRSRTGEGQWIDMSCTDAGALLNGPALLDFTVNGRPMRRPGSPESNRSQHPVMVPHGIYPSTGQNNWIAIACRDDRDWEQMARVIGSPWASDPRLATLARRVETQDEVDQRLAEWTRRRDRFELAAILRDAGVPATAVQRPNERIDDDPGTSEWGLWPTVTHAEMGEVRVDGLPVHFSKTDWCIERAAPCLGADNDVVFRGLLGHTAAELEQFRQEGVL
jgi:crotonobetainyl-CoA:carnitine CoA-transferase CaiB-like acyl-CoA transferase